MAVGAQQYALRRLSPDFVEGSRDAATCKSEGFGGGIDVMKLEGNGMAVIPAELAAAASLRNEYLLHLAPPFCDRLRSALLAPRMPVRADEGKLGLSMLPALALNGAEASYLGALKVLRRDGRSRSALSVKPDAVLLQLPADRPDGAIKCLRHFLERRVTLDERLKLFAGKAAAGRVFRPPVRGEAVLPYPVANR